jgi:hypothetical protein
MLWLVMKAGEIKSENVSENATVHFIGLIVSAYRLYQ